MSQTKKAGDKDLGGIDGPVKPQPIDELALRVTKLEVQVEQLRRWGVGMPDPPETGLPEGHEAHGLR